MALPGPPALEPWLLQVKEEPMEPLLPIVDPHHHLWYDRSAGMAGTAGQLSFGAPRSGFGHYMLPELLSDMQGNNVTHTVFLECGSFYDMSAPEELRTVQETRTCQQLADDHEMHGRPGALNHRKDGGTSVCAGIVSSVDL
eukprot:SAG22_NODE_6324_length_870_cov_1.214008_1_plen_140_part_01